ncbi:YopX family protein [Bacillus thuringiensis]|uniref:YopX protein domain-containing protein n=1 Tax=Bacillus thuringiensis subsp. higo TaxID=132266 RepID=A0A9X6LK27_BACUH|nr:YopX family protein [Bacillus thuringiensis]OUB48141.1 hypothetical protein BK716_19725 [Bacillus thuringiensis serovar higo]
MEGIKFRVWDKVANKWLDYEEIYFDQEGEVYLIEERTWAYQTYMHKENITENVETVRFTGLKDKNGKEIYEGDILKYEESINNGLRDIEVTRIAEVSFGLGMFWGGYGNNLAQVRREAKVIGNIYENPELLEESK